MLRTRPMEFTLGWELEACKRASVIPEGVQCGSDGSVSGDGVEYKIKDNMVRDIKGSLEALRLLARDKSIRVDKSCGFHVHLGLSKNTAKKAVWAGWMVTIGRMIEKEVFESVPESRRGNNYCRPMVNNGVKTILKTYYREKYSNDERYSWLNVVEMFRPGGIRTVEIRLLGNTHRYSYLVGWIAACRLMAKAAWALTNDPSCLESEISYLKSVFGEIRDGLLPSEGPINGVMLSTRLLRTSGIDGAPITRPLYTLEAAERDVAYTVRRERETAERQARQVREDRLTEHARELVTVEMVAAIPFVNQPVTRSHSAEIILRHFSSERNSRIESHVWNMIHEDRCYQHNCVVCVAERAPTRQLAEVA